MLYTQGNHFDFNQNISDTQNSAIVLMKTLKTQIRNTQYKTQTQINSSPTSEFIKEFNRQELLDQEKNFESNNKSNESTLVKTKNDDSNSTEINNNLALAIEHAEENRNNFNLKGKEILANKSINDRIRNARGKLTPTPKRKLNLSTDSRYKSLDIIVESQNEDLNEKKKKTN